MKYSDNLPQLNADVLQTVKSVDVTVILVICTPRKQLSMTFKQKRLNGQLVYPQGYIDNFQN
jgi:hypothetical protein